MNIIKRIGLAVFFFILGWVFFFSCASVRMNHVKEKTTERAPGESRAKSAGADIPPYLIERPQLLNFSAWQQTFDHDRPYPLRRLGGLGMGNGRTFALTAMTLPLNTWHNLTGPNHQLGWRFFSDLSIHLKQGEDEISWRTESVYRVKKTSVNIIRQEADGLSLWSIDFAPEGREAYRTGAGNALGRILVVFNHGDQTAQDIVLEARSAKGKAAGHLITESLPKEVRNLAASFAAGKEQISGRKRSISLPLGDIPAGGQAVVPFFAAFALNGPAEPVLEGVLSANYELLLTETIKTWQDYFAKGAQLTTSEPKFDELIESILVTIRNQTTETGGVSEMSRYSHTWLRDIMGPARLLPYLGRSDEYKRMLDYYYRAALVNGNIANALPLDVPDGDLPQPPDWENLPTGTGRESAESVSYLILHYKEYLGATGDLEPIRSRYGMLRHALIHQDLSPDSLLPFSDDETFRGALAVANGIWAGNKFQKSHYSANSSFLFVAAAEFMEQMAQRLDREEHATQYAELARRVRQSTERHYWLADQGFYAPMLVKRTKEPFARPYEDINTKPLWSGYLSPEDPQARANVENSIKALDSVEGVPFSPIDPTYAPLKSMLGFKRGVLTGMTYGYWLDNFNRLDHPLAAKIFPLYDRIFHPTGVISEYMVADDFGRLVYFYNPKGLETDQSAGYRSWEGGLNGAALLGYLFGLELDAVNNSITIAPHLPEDWTFARLTGLEIGDTSFDLEVRQDDQGQTITVGNLSGSLQVNARISLSQGDEIITVNGRTDDFKIERTTVPPSALLTGLTADKMQVLVIKTNYR